MFTYNERDLHRMPTPARTHLPIKQFIADSNILDSDETGKSETDADIALLRLPAPGLRGTFARAYALLTRLVAKIGWDELLKTRSAVFVMEEEYRAQKAAAATTASTENLNGDGQVIMEDGTVVGPSINGKSADDDASIRAMQSPRDNKPLPSSGPGSVASVGKLEAPSQVPIIRVSSESDRSHEHVDGDDEHKANGAASSDAESESGQEITVGQTAAQGLEKPSAVAANDEEPENTGRTSPRPNQESKGQSDAFSFSNKRLCERWLDNLFMVLYEVC